MKPRVLLVGVAALAVAASGRAPAQVSPRIEPVAATIDRAAIESLVRDAKLRTTAPFVAVSRVRARVVELDRKRRGPLAAVGPFLAAVKGPFAFEALAEALVLTPEDPTWTTTARRAFRAGLVEAIGRLREPRARSLLVAHLDDEDPLVARMAAEGIGRYGDDAAVSILVPRILRRDAAAVASAGVCRRRSIAHALASIASGPSASKDAIRALGEIGSSWAWATGAVPSKDEESDVRAIAARALVAAFVAHRGELRDAASNALMMVDAPSTPALVEAAKHGASIDDVAALDALAARFANNPAR